MFVSIKKFLAALLALAVLVPIALADTPIHDDGILRVWLKSLGKTETLHLTFAGNYAVEGDAGFRFDRDTAVELRASGDRVWMHTGGLTLDMGRSVTFTRHAADGENGIYLEESEKPNLYNGDLSISTRDGALQAVLSIDIEEYLRGVVAYEMSDSFPIEALKAQAVAARTYAMGRKYASGGRDYDVTDTTSDQVFKGFDPNYQNVIAAVDATRGCVGRANGGFAGCYYTASNGGQIAAPGDIWGGDDGGYILMRDDPYDLENPRSLVNSVSFAADLSDCAALKAMVERALAETLDDSWTFDTIRTIRAANPVPEDSRMYRTLRLLVRAHTDAPEPAEKSVWIELSVYDQIKDGLNIGLNGSDYELITALRTDRGFALEMRRFGHGVGMSQRGAQWMAGEYGFGWQDILKFYYPGMTLESIDWQTPPLTALDNLAPAMGRARPDPTPVPTPAPLPALEANERYAAVTLQSASSTLNVRETPSTAARVLDKLASGRRVIACGEPDAEGWIQIRTAEFTGYVRSDYLTIEP